MIGLAALFLLACDANAVNRTGGWSRVDPPPNHPELTCYVWSAGILDQTYGGPVCIVSIPAISPPSEP